MLLIFAIQTDLHRHTLRQSHPFQIIINGRQPFAIRTAAAIGDPRRDTINSAMQNAVATQRGDFRSMPWLNAFQLGLFQIG